MTRVLAASCAAIVFALGAAAGGAWPSRVEAQGFTVVMVCGAASTAQLRTTLYFGLMRAKGAAISELEWQIFLRDEVTRRFPQGLTTWEAEGQWRNPGGSIEHERSKVLLLVHGDTAEARTAVQELIATYRRLFDQESVLWESSRVCVSS
jgi:hypothetical protein